MSVTITIVKTLLYIAAAIGTTLLIITFLRFFLASSEALSAQIEPTITAAIDDYQAFNVNSTYCESPECKPALYIFHLVNLITDTASQYMVDIATWTLEICQLFLEYYSNPGLYLRCEPKYTLFGFSWPYTWDWYRVSEFHPWFPRVPFFVKLVHIRRTPVCRIIDRFYPPEVIELLPNWEVFFAPVMSFLILTLTAVAYHQIRIWNTGLDSSYVVREWIFSAFATKAPDYTMYRNVFNRLEVPTSKVAKHNHGQSAADRSAGQQLIHHFAMRVGLEPYSIQRSANNQRKNTNGSRTFFWSKDLQMDAKDFQLEERSLPVMIDVDYYVDMDRFLATHRRPTAIYTFQPKKAAKNTGDYTYKFDANGVVHYSLSGAGSYAHQVWNYQVDNLMTVKRFFGFPVNACAYHVERLAIDADHEVVLFCPIRSFGWTTAWITMFVSGTPLVRMDPIVAAKDDKFVRIAIMDGQTMRYSIANVDSNTEVTITAAEHDAVVAAGKSSKTGVYQPLVASTCNVDRNGAAILTPYFQAISGYSDTVVFPPELSVHHYQFFSQAYDYDAPVGMKPFMSPLIIGATAPRKSKANDEQFARQRIIAPANALLEVTTKDLVHIEEFIELLFGSSRNTLVPTTMDEVYDRQSRPTQRVHLDRSLDFPEPHNQVISAFQKLESYGEIKNPRPISTVNSTYKREYSRYTYALTDYVKQQSWYAFGQCPADVAATVSKICMVADSVDCGDFKQYDGKISNKVRVFERTLISAAFKPEYLPQVHELLSSSTGLKAYTTCGAKYDTLFERKSGDPETAIMNTITNKFMDYVTRRTTVREDGSYAQPLEAYNAPGLFGGDDSLAADRKPSVSTRVAKNWGMQLETNVVQRGEFGVNFLSRYYTPDVWTGCDISCCDIKRQLLKLHLTVNLPLSVTPKRKLLEKLRSFYMTDRNTPVFKQLIDICLKEISAFPDPTPELRPMMRWESDMYELSEQYPNRDEAWMMAFMADQLPGFDWEKFLVWCASARLDDILNMPVCWGLDKPVAAHSSLTADVNGQIVGPSSDVKSLVNAPPVDLDRGHEQSVEHARSVDPVVKSGKIADVGTKALAKIKDNLLQATDSKVVVHLNHFAVAITREIIDKLNPEMHDTYDIIRSGQNKITSEGKPARVTYWAQLHVHVQNAAIMAECLMYLARNRSRRPDGTDAWFTGKTTVAVKLEQHKPSRQESDKKARRELLCKAESDSDNTSAAQNDRSVKREAKRSKSKEGKTGGQQTTKKTGSTEGKKSARGKPDHLRSDHPQRSGKTQA